MPKNIVVLSDGTGQEGGRGHDTNIYKLFRMLEDRTDRQVVFYDQGLGTDWRKVTGNAFGAGFSVNIQQCYRFIYDHYEAGDKIFLLGFSRGAATVRSLANFIHYFGILPKARPGLIARAWRLYRAGSEDHEFEAVTSDESAGAMRRMTDKGLDLIDRTTRRIDTALRASLNESAKKFVREHPNQWASIEFLGVYDTVPALGLVPLAGLNLLINNLPWWKHRFHDFKLHESVRTAYHALSIDDDRLWFHPTIWKECTSEQVVQQVWFSGSHTDVGGGFMAAGLSDLALEWMVEKGIDHGLRLYFGSREDWNFAIAPDATDRWHPPRAGFGRIYAYALRDQVWDEKAVDSYGPPKVHQSVIDRARHDPTYRPWILTGYNRFLNFLPGLFADWLAEQHQQGYDRAYETYAETMMGGDSAPAAEPPATREEWLEQNPFDRWLEQHHPDYRNRLLKVQDDTEMLKWLNFYPPFRAWRTEKYPGLTETEFGPIAVEPYSRLFEYQDASGTWQLRSEDLDEAACAAAGFVNKRPILFRDYDQESLLGMIERGLDFSARGLQDNLVERLVLVRPIVEFQPPDRSRRKPKSALRQWMNRSVYDRERWYPQRFGRKNDP